MTSDTNKVIIIGNGTAGLYAAKAIRERNNHIEIVMYGEEPSLAYHRPMLTKALLTNKSVEKMLMKPSKWYEEQNIKVVTNTKVERIDSSNKTVQLANNQTDTYDKLIIATGATSFIPPIPGANLKNVFAIRSYADMKRIEEAAAQVKRVVVIGGGVLGLEAAWQFHKQGIHVTVLELAPKLMVRQLDDMSSDLLYQLIKNLGMDVRVGVQIEAITGSGQVEGVRLGDGTTFDAELVLMSTGIRAEVSLAKEAGIEVNRAIVVNEHCETNVPGIYAAGDCAEYAGINYGILPEAQKMGEVAGSNVAGEQTRYETVQAAIIFHGMNTQLYAIGDVGKDNTKQYTTKVLQDESKNLYAGYYFVDDVFSGAVLFGDTKDMRRVSDAYENKMTFEEMFPN